MERRAIIIRGVVQGLGFRPFIYRLASGLHLAGFVRNQAGSLLVEVEGEAPQLDRFLREVSSHPPGLSKIEDLCWKPRPVEGEQSFRVDDTQKDECRDVAIASNIATCNSCRGELLDPENRRYLYPFLNCAECGPRLSIMTGAPYDRRHTSMAEFAMCSACRSEYDDPLDRRFHAESTACPSCGPQLTYLNASGRPEQWSQDALYAFASVLTRGGIGALKSLGGYHLACDARRDQSVLELRRRTGRAKSPLAIMVADAQAAARWCELDSVERRLLESRRAPIVLLNRQIGMEVPLSEAVAFGSPWLGVMLPIGPLHHLLSWLLKGIPLVMTCANRFEEPRVYTDRAPDHLVGIADAYLIHNRSIRVRCDDSVVRVVDGLELPLRRSRGYAPEPLEPPMPTPATLAVGGQRTSTFALGKGNRLYLSHHLGDLHHTGAYHAFTRDVRLYEVLFSITPLRIVHDLHPDYASTHYARNRSLREGIEAVAVQHHHAHVASCMADNGLSAPVIGVTFDGAGYGLDGQLWGGEFLVGDYRGFHRAAHLEEIAIPGGEHSFHEPWKMAVSCLIASGERLDRIEKRIGGQKVDSVRRLLDRHPRAIRTSSAEMLLDGIASIMGLFDDSSYEGRALLELEALALKSSDAGCYPSGITKNNGSWVLRTTPIISGLQEDLSRGISQAKIARRLHTTLVELIRRMCLRIRDETGIDQVVLSGGVFSNGILLTEVPRVLRQSRFRVYRHQRVPSNDGGLCLGQLVVAAAGGGTRS